MFDINRVRRVHSNGGPINTEGSTASSVALDAFTTTTLLSKCPVEIRSLACWVPAASQPSASPAKTLVFVSTAEGTLVVYELRKSGGTSPWQFKSIFTKKRAVQERRHPVTQLQISDRWGLLLGVLDQRLITYNLAGTPPLEEFLLGLHKLRGVQCFTILPEADLTCVAAGQALLVFRWSFSSGPVSTRTAVASPPPTSTAPAALASSFVEGLGRGGAGLWGAMNKARASSEASAMADTLGGGPSRRGSFVPLRTINLANQPLSVQWAGPLHVCAGFLDGYCIVDIETGKEGRIGMPDVSSESTPPSISVVRDYSATSMQESSQPVNIDSSGALLLGQARHAMLVDFEGRSLVDDEHDNYSVDDHIKNTNNNGNRSNRGRTQLNDTDGVDNNEMRDKRRSSMVEWVETPSMVLSCQPYVIALGRTQLYVHTLPTSHLQTQRNVVQEIAMPSNLRFACTTVNGVCNGSIPGPLTSNSTASDSKALVFVCTDFSIHLLALRPASEQVKQFASRLSGNGSISGLSHIASLAHSFSMPPWTAAAAACLEGPAIGTGCTFDEVHRLERTALRSGGMLAFQSEQLNVALDMLNRANLLGGFSIPDAIGLFSKTDLFASENEAEQVIANLTNALRDVVEELKTESEGDGRFSDTTRHRTNDGQWTRNGSLGDEYRSDGEEEMDEVYHTVLMLERYLKSDASTKPRNKDTGRGSTNAVEVAVNTIESVGNGHMVDKSGHNGSLGGLRLVNALRGFLLPFVMEIRDELLASPQIGIDNIDNNIDINDNNKNNAKNDNGDGDNDGLDSHAKLLALYKALDQVLLRAFVVAGAAGGANVTSGGALFHENKLKFLQGKNWCTVEDCQNLLLRFPEMWQDQIWLYYSKGEHRQALEWLRTMAKTKESTAPATSTANALPSVYALKSVEYMRKLSKRQSALVVEFSQWLLERQPTLGLQVFMVKQQSPQRDRHVPVSAGATAVAADGASGVTGIGTRSIGDVYTVPPEQVLKLLGVFDRSAKSSATARQRPQPMPLSVLYFEYLIYECGETDATVHTALAKLLFNSIVACTATITTPTSKTGNNNNNNNNSNNNNNNNPISTVTSRASLDLQSKLDRLLTSSTSLNTTELLELFRTSGLHRQYALLLHQAGQHDQAVTHLVLKLGSVPDAERYCGQVYNPSNPTTRGVYLALIKACIDRQGLASPQAIQSVIQLMLQHHDKISVARALALLPRDLPLVAVGPLLDLTLRYQAARVCDVRVRSQLAKQEHLDMMRAKAESERTYIVITEDRLCANSLCRARFSDDAAIVRLANGQVMHYACWAALEEEDEEEEGGGQGKRSDIVDAACG